VSLGTPGWFGKIPNLGDFASRRLPDDFVHGWDAWLQHGLAAARELLGETWLDCYLVAPIRRFWLAPGLLGATGWAGLMMPSVDRVGRHFPLTIARPANGGPDGLAEVLASRDWFDTVDQAARRVLDVEFTLDDFELELLRVAAEAMEPEPAAPATQALAEELLRPLQDEPSAEPRSLWWCGDEQQASDFLRYPGLPPPPAFVSLMQAGC
jgi:type VI secretion system protein ImpM